MKRTKIFILFISLLLFLDVRGQAEIKIPKFQGDILVIRTLESDENINTTALTISDGSDVKFSAELKTIRGKNEFDNARTLATVVNLIIKQGYKIISSNSGGGGGRAIIVSTYIFQKE